MLRLPQCPDQVLSQSIWCLFQASICGLCCLSGCIVPARKSAHQLLKTIRSGQIQCGHIETPGSAWCVHKEPRLLRALRQGFQRGGKVCRVKAPHAIHCDIIDRTRAEVVKLQQPSFCAKHASIRKERLPNTSPCLGQGSASSQVHQMGFSSRAACVVPELARTASGEPSSLALVLSRDNQHR